MGLCGSRRFILELKGRLEDFVLHLGESRFRLVRGAVAGNVSVESVDGERGTRPLWKGLVGIRHGYGWMKGSGQGILLAMRRKSRMVAH